MIDKKNADSKLFDLRAKHGITQEKLSTDTGISRTTIANIENDKLSPHATTIYKLNEFFKKYGEQVD